MPMRRMALGCCARAMRDEIAAPVKTPRNSRRLMSTLAPVLLVQPWYRGNSVLGRDYVRFGSKADICGATSDVRFTPNSDREGRHPQTVMSASPPKADMCSAIG